MGINIFSAGKVLGNKGKNLIVGTGMKVINETKKLRNEMETTSFIDNITSKAEEKVLKKMSDSPELQLQILVGMLMKGGLSEEAATAQAIKQLGIECKETEEAEEVELKKATKKTKIAESA